MLQLIKKKRIIILLLLHTGCPYGMMCAVALLFTACRSTPVVPDEQPPSQVTVNLSPSTAYLSPEESMKTMHLPPGYHLQLVASEPVIQEPVAIVWDGNGAMYVAEMRSYMQDINGTGEGLPVCRITKLEDTDGDGKMDKHTIFIDSLVLPRMMLMLDNQLVVNETYSYNLYGYRDTNGDGRADEKKLLYHNDQPDNANLEHQRSGLIWNMDNRIYTTTSPARYRYENGMLQADSIYSTSGQWGLAHDDYGRLFFSSAGGEDPALDFQQNPAYGRLGIDNQLLDNFEAVWPAISTPDVEGGKIRLRGDSTLNHFTASCGQTIFRGDKLPASMKGDLFICEPAGRLIRRSKIIDSNGTFFLKNAYDKTEFLTSSDMNFRPVNTDTGPDGCLYIVDMYHGIIQESGWTKEGSYLRPQILQKGLDTHINRGRIYRLVHDGSTPGPAPHLLNEDNGTLVSHLSHPNGWWRDNAQKLLIIHNDKSVVPALKKIINEPGFLDKILFWKSRPPAISKIHALWTLEGLQSADKEILKTAYRDKDPELRKAAVRISEPYLKNGDDQDLWIPLERLKNDTSADVRIQLALSLRYEKNKRSGAVLKELAAGNNGALLKKVIAESQQEEDPSLKQLRAATAGMDEEDKTLVFNGAAAFSQLCANCHGPEGKGLPSLIAPPLSGSARVNGNKDTLIKILLYGLTGPVDNKIYPGMMPPQAANTNEYIASVASFIRNSMGNRAKVILPEDVQKVRDQERFENLPSKKTFPGP
jgi:mono/diheme cytochrome c family protein/glucose/arabinose dehydrogenase